MIRRPPRSTPLYSSAASDVYKRQVSDDLALWHGASGRTTSSPVCIQACRTDSRDKLRAFVPYNKNWTTLPTLLSTALPRPGLRRRIFGDDLAFYRNSSITCLEHSGNGSVSYQVSSVGLYVDMTAHVLEFRNVLHPSFFLTATSLLELASIYLSMCSKYSVLSTMFCLL